MDQLYLLQNHDKLFLTKQNEWCDGRDLGSLFKTRQRDEALNHLVEVNAKDVYQRIHILECPIKSNGFPDIAPEHLPPAIPKPSAEAGEQLADLLSAEADSPATDEHLQTESGPDASVDADGSDSQADSEDHAGNPSAEYRVHEL